MLVAATLVWGGSFVVTRQAVQGVAPLVFVGLRFGVAAMLVALFTRPALHRVTRTEWAAAGFITLAMFGGYAGQAWGMHLGLTAGQTAFISALYVPLVPLLQLAFLRRAPGRLIWLGLALAFAGLMLMAGPQGGIAAGPGLLVLGGALSTAAEILLISRFARHVDVRRLAVMECAMLSALCLAVSLVSGAPLPVRAESWVGAGVLLGLGSAGLQLAVNWAQRHVPATRATLIYTLEPVWAAMFGLLIGERMGWPALAGAALILASLLIGGVRQEETQHLA